MVMEQDHPLGPAYSFPIYDNEKDVGSSYTNACY